MNQLESKDLNNFKTALNVCLYVIIMCFILLLLLPFAEYSYWDYSDYNNMIEIDFSIGLLFTGDANIFDLNFEYFGITLISTIAGLVSVLIFLSNRRMEFIIFTGISIAAIYIDTLFISKLSNSTYNSGEHIFLNSHTYVICGILVAACLVFWELYMKYISAGETI